MNLGLTAAKVRRKVAVAGVSLKLASRHLVDRLVEAARQTTAHSPTQPMNVEVAPRMSSTAASVRGCSGATRRLTEPQRGAQRLERVRVFREAEQRVWTSGAAFTDSARRRRPNAEWHEDKSRGNALPIGRRSFPSAQNRQPLALGRRG